MNIKDKTPAQLMSQLMKNPVFKTVFSNWANMLLHWKPAGLHGLGTISAIESAVVYCVLEAVQAQKTDAIFQLFIDIAKPINFCYQNKEGVLIHKTITVNQTPKLIS